MPFVPVAQTALVELRMLCAGQHVENTIYALAPDPFDPSSLTSLANTVKAWWIAEMAPLLSDIVSLEEVVATDLTTATGGQVSISGDHELGTQIGGAAPNGSTFTVSFRTAERGRAFRGRNYIVGLPLEQLSDTNHVQSSWATDLITAYEALKTALVAADFIWVVVSRFHGVDTVTGHPIPRAAGLITHVLSVLVTDFVIDSQRRRLPGRGT
jgi:hypothetical protein